MKHSVAEKDYRLKELLLLAFAAALLSAGEAKAITVTSASITGPECLQPDVWTNYTLTISGTGAAVNDFLYFSVYDNDDFDVDDLLQDETGFFIYQTGNWTLTQTFQLKCDTFLSDEITGKDGDAGQDHAEVYALIETIGGTDLFTTAQLNVKCCDDVPEGGNTLALLGLVTGALVLVRTDKRKCIS